MILAPLSTQLLTVAIIDTLEPEPESWRTLPMWKVKFVGSVLNPITPRSFPLIALMVPAQWEPYLKN